MTVAPDPINAFEPINFILNDSPAPDKYLMSPVLVMPNLNISIKEPAAINNTHWPNTSTVKLLANMAKPEIPKKAITKFPVKERKLSSRTILWSFFFNAVFIFDF